MAARGKRGKRQFGDNGFGEWGGYMAAKKAKLEEQFSETCKKESDINELEKNKGIFDGVAIFVNGYTEPTADELKRIMMVNGGVFHHYQSSRTTHIIAKNLPDVKVKALRGNEIIVKPCWITDSLKAKKLLDYRPYLLFTNQTNNQPQLKFKKVLLVEEAEKSRPILPVLDTKELSPTKKTIDAKDENFLGDFYNNSRLHLISSMKSHFKNYVTQLRNSNKEMVFPKRQSLTTYSLVKQDQCKVSSNGKIIMHIDMDCFFVSVSLRSYPDLRGKPVGVAHAKGNKHDGSESWSEIASCSYEARKSGVKNGMFVGPAKNICPDLKIIPYDFEGYQSVAQTLYDTVSQYTLDIQAVSCDEMIVDLTSLFNSIASFDEIDFGEQLRREIYEATLCTASIGMGPNILLAKIATKSAKPNGIFKISDDCDLEKFMKDIKVRDLPGVGRVLAEKLKVHHSVETCEHLQEITLQTLKQEFGVKTGQSLFDLCRGRDGKSQLDYDEERKSVSAEINYGIRFSDISEAEKFIGQLSDEVCKRLLDVTPGRNLVAKQVTLKIMTRSTDAPVETRKYMGHGICDSFSKSANMSIPTNEASSIKRETMILLKMLLKSNGRDVEDLRGIGIQLSKLEKNSSQVPSIISFMNKSKNKLAIAESFESSKESSIREEKLETKPTNSNTLSLSQIDQDTLDELPSHIKEEILQSISSDSRPSQDNGATDNVSDEPSRSDEVTTTYTNQNMSFSQFDPNVLSELPLEIQKELKSQFSSKPHKLSSSHNRIMPIALNKVPSVLSKIQGKRSKGSPRSCKNPKGPSIAVSKNTESRPNKRLFETETDNLRKYSISIKKLSNENTNEDGTNVDYKSEKSDDNRSNVIAQANPSSEMSHVVESDEGRASCSRHSDKSVESDNTQYTEKDVSIENENKSHSNSKTTLDINNSIEDLRSLLRKWTKSFVTPTYDDVDTICNYFKSQITENNIEIVYLGLKSLCRNCLNADNPANWTGAYNGIVREVQRAMLRSYGKRLSVNFKF